MIDITRCNENVGCLCISCALYSFKDELNYITEELNNITKVLNDIYDKQCDMYYKQGDV